MAKERGVRTLMGSQHVKGFKALPKSVRQYFCHYVWSLWKKIGAKNFVLVASQILRLFVNILTPMKCILCQSKRGFNANNAIMKYSYLEIIKFFLNFFLHLQNLDKILNTLE